MRARRTDHDLLLPYLFPHLFAVVCYRVAHALGTRGLAPIARLVQILGLMLTGAELDWRAEIGPGLFLEHPHGVEIGDGVVIGSNTVLGLAVLLGSTFTTPTGPGSRRSVTTSRSGPRPRSWARCTSATARSL